MTKRKGNDTKGNVPKKTKPLINNPPTRFRNNSSAFNTSSLTAYTSALTSALTSAAHDQEKNHETPSRSFTVVGFVRHDEDLDTAFSRVCGADPLDPLDPLWSQGKHHSHALVLCSECLLTTAISPHHVKNTRHPPCFHGSRLQRESPHLFPRLLELKADVDAGLPLPPYVMDRFSLLLSPDTNVLFPTRDTFYAGGSNRDMELSCRVCAPLGLGPVVVSTNHLFSRSDHVVLPCYCSSTLTVGSSEYHDFLVLLATHGTDPMHVMGLCPPTKCTNAILSSRSSSSYYAHIRLGLVSPLLDKAEFASALEQAKATQGITGNNLSRVTIPWDCGHHHGERASAQITRVADGKGIACSTCNLKTEQVVCMMLQARDSFLATTSPPRECKWSWSTWTPPGFPKPSRTSTVANTRFDLYGTLTSTTTDDVLGYVVVETDGPAHFDIGAHHNNNDPHVLLDRQLLDLEKEQHALAHGVSVIRIPQAKTLACEFSPVPSLLHPALVLIESDLSSSRPTFSARVFTPNTPEYTESGYYTLHHECMTADVVSDYTLWSCVGGQVTT